MGGGDRRRGALAADLVVLATEVTGVKAIVGASRGLDDADWRRRIDSLRVTNAFAVWRLWLDRPVATGRSGFAGTAGVGPLDNISVYENLEDESRAWAARTGGSVVELHAYALPAGFDEVALRRQLLEGLHTLYPETSAATLIEDRFLLRQDCPAFAPGSHALRPEVRTPFRGLCSGWRFRAAAVPFRTDGARRVSGRACREHPARRTGSRGRSRSGRSPFADLWRSGRHRERAHSLRPSPAGVAPALDAAGLAAGRSALDGGRARRSPSAAPAAAGSWWTSAAASATPRRQRRRCATASMTGNWSSGTGRTV